MMTFGKREDEQKWRRYSGSRAAMIRLVYLLLARNSRRDSVKTLKHRSILDQKATR